MAKIVLKLKTPITFLTNKAEKDLARMEVLQKEIELKCELIDELGGNYSQGKPLDDEELEGRKYMLSCYMPF
jgi:hypothetical protein